MYNPFKWHIATNGVGNYVIRRRVLFGWEYLDRGGNYKWRDVDHLLRWCVFTSLIEAKSVFHNIPTKWTYLKS